MSKGPCLGSKVSLISNSEIRYEGILYTFDTKECTVALAKVKSFGTEDRLTDRPVAPRNEIYEYIIFRASDIKDLHVCEPPKLIGSLPDPAIVQHSPPVPIYPSISYGPAYEAFGLNPFASLSQGSYSHHMASVLSGGHYSGERHSTRSTTPASQRKSPTTDTGVQVCADSLDSIQDPRIEARNQMRQRARDSQINYQNQRRVNQVPRRSENLRRGLPRRGRGRGSILSSTDVLKFESEYDFEQANAEFQELESKLEKNKIDDSSQQNSLQSSEDSGFYDKKKSFFDDISCEATQRMKGFDWRIERKLNVETFGASANNSWLRRRRGRGGYRRGGFRNRGGFSRPEITQPKTVTFDETLAIKEVEREPEEKKPVEFPVIEITVEKEKDWPEEKGEISVWN